MSLSVSLQLNICSYCRPSSVCGVQAAPVRRSLVHHFGGVLGGSRLDVCTGRMYGWHASE